MARVIESEIRTLSAGLYLVATPIGNLGDMGLRAVETLRSVGLIACEDTRVTAKLCQAFDITTRRIRFDSHQPPEARARLLDQIAAGLAVALVSDAGSPLVSDPGQELVSEAIARGIKTEVIPGASAVMAALIGSGLPVQPFAFFGFPDRHRPTRLAQFTEVKDFNGTLVYFESPHRASASLFEMAEVMGDRQAVVARELTKIYEEYRRGTLRELAAQIDSGTPLKGECVIVIAPPILVTKKYTEAEIDGLILRGLTTMSLRDTVQTLADATGLPRRSLFTRALELQEGRPANED
ncbi:MAG: 16S rRNA (cytidine(1402)-2'-O)-methyltransferase [Candidatus Pacebacteria bacterium]|nr:16S rRNA (cytidine(1402)-2'-O)-methyltransferase [Candidatus Paceibacterota bacterium]